MNMKSNLKLGFTIVELLIVIVVIAILASISVVAYNGIKERARHTSIQSDIRQVHRLLELYHADHGTYPVTGTTTLAGAASGNETYADSNCVISDETKVTRSANWVPGISEALPQSDGNIGKGVGNHGGCYFYTSDGRSYILSAWNMLTSPQDSNMYRRIGFREMSASNIQYYYCNQVNIGGNSSVPYTITKDYYKRSYTITNITFCNETPPAGA
jgi:prepilin-type N-terminal cleavage/methylation domain-containing protein